MKTTRLSLLAAVLCFYGTAAATPVEKIALVIGNNKGLFSETPLKYAQRDAERVHAIFDEVGGVRKDRNYLLTGEKMSRTMEVFHEVKGRVQEMKNGGSQVAIYIYYSGHADPEALHLNGDKLPVHYIKEFFNSLDADLRVMFVDACYSGAMLREKGMTLGKPITITVDQEMKTKGAAVITSSSSGELSYESEELQGSLFTHYLLSGLRGGADINNDNAVSLLEAYQFTQVQTQRRIRRTSSGKQSPGFDIDLVGQKDVILTRPGTGSSHIRFSGCTGEEYSIVSPRTQEILAQVSPARGETLTIAVPRDQYYIQRRTSHYLFVKPVDLTWGAQAEFDPAGMEMYPLEAVVSKGRLNWRYRPYNAVMRVKVRRDLPTNTKWMVIPQLLFRYTWRQYLVNIAVGTGKDRLNGDVLDLKRSYWDASAIVSRRLWHNRLVVVDGGIEAGIIRMTQERIRPDEYALRALGYEALPDLTSNIWQLGVQQNLHLKIMYGVGLNLQAGVTGYVYDGGDGATVKFGVPVAVGVGIRF